MYVYKRHTCVWGVGVEGAGHVVQLWTGVPCFVVSLRLFYASTCRRLAAVGGGRRTSGSGCCVLYGEDSGWSSPVALSSPPPRLPPRLQT